jgi:hypothetical protein
VRILLWPILSYRLTRPYTRHFICPDCRAIELIRGVCRKRAATIPVWLNATSVRHLRVRELCRQCVTTTPYEWSLSTIHTARTWLDQSHGFTCTLLCSVRVLRARTRNSYPSSARTQLIASNAAERHGCHCAVLRTHIERTEDAAKCFRAEPGVPLTANRLGLDDAVLGRDRKTNPDCWPPDCNYEGG